MGPHLGPPSGPESGANQSSTHCWCWFGWSQILGRKMGPDCGSSVPVANLPLGLYCVLDTQCSVPIRATSCGTAVVHVMNMSQTVGLTPRDRGLSVDIVWEKIRPGRVAFFGHKEHAAADAPFANTSFFRCSAEVGVISRKQPSQHASPSWDMLAQIPTNWSENKVGRLRGCFPLLIAAR